MKINKYPDGSSYIILSEENKLDPFIFKLNTYEDLWHLNQLVEVWSHRYGILDIKPLITIPNLIDAQADRRFDKNQSSGLKLICNFLNNMNASFKIFHPHNPEVVEALMDNVEIIDNSLFIKRILYSGSLEHDYYFEKHNKLILMSADAGGFKPLIKVCDKINWKGETYSASKARKYIDGETKLTQLIDRKDFKGKDILIVDDISVYGGTFKGLSKLLRERNCGKLYLAISHMTIQNLGDDPVTNYFDKVFTTNSKFDNYFVANRKGEPKTPKNLEIIKLF